MATDAAACVFLAAVFTDVVWEYKSCYTLMIFIRPKMAQNNQSHMVCHMFLRIFYFWGIYHLPPGFLSLRREEPLPELEDNGMDN